FLGRAFGWYGVDDGAGLIGAVVGAVIVLLIWGAIAKRRSVSDRF
ncbi:MAG TPA: GlsB/YeaQ/YmgE family stress response membrane protein, partial [Methylomirabilota bacterium]|nr:GlsB/YeaQ/YmgE family stress response membrane protein [Methylomirabilota bacterium]